MKDFRDRTVWVTGASSGIGRAVSVALACQGARLILSGRNEAALQDVARDLGRDALVLPFDAVDYERLPEAAARALDWRGGVDLLFNNAGISQRSLAIDTDFDVYRRIMEVDFFAPVRLTQLVLPAMVERGSGHLAVTSSVAGKLGVPLRTGYSAAKHAVLGWFDALRAEVELAYGIAVSVVVPGSVRTAIAANSLSGTGEVRGRSDANIDSGMSVDDAADRIVAGLAGREREILVAEGQEAQAVLLRAQQPEALFDLVARQGKALADARAQAGPGWQPEPGRTR